jgi:hypothetical protein
MKLQELKHKTADSDQKNSKSNEKTKIQCNSTDNSIFIDPPVTTTTSTTINQNGGTFLFHSLDGCHDSSKGNNDINCNRTMAMTSSSSSSSECFGMKFVPCYK